MKVKALADRFGSNRINAHRPAELLQGCTLVAIPFAGGMCEVPHFGSLKPKVSIILVNDLDRAVVNLAEIARDRCDELIEYLDGTIFCEESLRKSQEFCRKMAELQPATSKNCLGWACHYFICSWMAHGGRGGTDAEFRQPFSVRWKSTGGDSSRRFRSAVEGLREWQAVMRRCTFTAEDATAFLCKLHERDNPKNGIFCDPPWFDDGGLYKHKFSTMDHLLLAKELLRFKETKVAVRLGEHPLVTEIYTEDRWRWHRLESRTQANSAKAEVLLELKHE